MIEIERKFLVDAKKWSKHKKGKAIQIHQGYIFDESNGVLRVRIKGEKAYLTLKSATFHRSRLEYEYEIPMADAQSMMKNLCKVVLSKTRTLFEYQGKQWEIDEFQDELSPLLLAEIELNSENEEFELPDFITTEVTSDKRYYNSELIKQIKREK